MKMLVIGGVGFTGSAIIRHIITNINYSVVNVDRLTYAGNSEFLASVDKPQRYSFKQKKVCNCELKQGI
jgi:dTDP-glucose 4,6-dehydratase